MYGTNTVKLSMEEIIQKIKEEVNKRKNDVFKNFSNKNIFNEVNALDNGIEPFIQHDVYEYSDFTKYYDVEFIKNCYKGLLKREADIDGLSNYLKLLRSGEKSKSEIISLIRFSKEGREKNVKLLGAKKRFFITVLNNIRLLRPVFKWFTTFYTLPKLVKRLNKYENFTYQLYEKNLYNEFKLQKAFNNNISISFKKIDKELETIKSEIDNKADKSELETMDIVSFKFENLLAKAVSLTKHSLNDKNVKNESMYYSLFEDAFYESKIVKEKQKYYLKYIQNTSKKYHLDLGCGRGEFLEILKEHEIPALGIDINPIEIERLKTNNFNVKLIDIEEFFKQNIQIFSSISALQVFEHLTIDKIKKILQKIYMSLELNGIVVIETVNPHSPFAFGGFYMDETHIRPIPPEQFAFMMQWYGFKDIEVVYSSKLPKEFWVSEIKRNYYDYALIGYKR